MNSSWQSPLWIQARPQFDEQLDMCLSPQDHPRSLLELPTLKHVQVVCKSSEISWKGCITGSVNDSVAMQHHIKAISERIQEAWRIFHVQFGLTFMDIVYLVALERLFTSVSPYSTPEFYTLFSCRVSVVEMAGSPMK